MAFPVSMYGTLTDVKESHSTQRHPLGTRLVLDDGRVFHYALNAGTQLAVGKLCSSPLVDADENVDLVLDAAATTAAKNATLLADMSTASAYVAANRFKDGWMYVNVGTGAGQVVRLNTNDKGGSTADGSLKVYFADENYLSVALDTSSSKIGLVQNPYMDVIVSPAYASLTATSRPCGVPIATIPASKYFWLQTWGPCPILMGSTPVEGEVVVQGGSSTGAAGEVNNGYALATSSSAVGGIVDFAQVGVVMSGDADAEYALIFLMIDP